MDELEQTVDGNSLSIVADKLKKMRLLFPEVFSEGRVDFDVLREVLGDYVDVRQERYSFTWHGKADARRIAQAPSLGTLRPAPEFSSGWDTTQNLFIEGDNLEVLKLLQKSYYGRVKMIYIDPPYNTGGEFIYPDKYQDNLDTYLRYTGQKDSDGLKMSANTESSGRYHTNWLNMMYPRLRLARNLLRDDGAIFISIDENEAANLRKIGDEIFGEENFLCNFTWQKRYAPPPDTKDVGYEHENILMWRKSEAFRANLLPMTEEQKARYKNPDADPRGPWKAENYTCRYTADERPNLYYPITNPNTGEECWPKRTRVWAMSKEVTERNLAEDRIWWGKDGSNSVPALKNFLSDIKQGISAGSLLLHEDAGHTDEAAKELRELVPDVKFTPKPTRLIQHLASIASDPDALVLDFFAGSATTGHALMKMNAADGGCRRFILVQLPEPINEGSAEYRAGYRTIADIGRERLTRAAESIQGDGAPLLDAGFRCYRLSSSNLKTWDPATSDLQSSLLEAESSLKPDRSDEDLLAELLLKYGLDLALPARHVDIDGVDAQIVGDGALVAVLDDHVDERTASGIVGLLSKLEPEVTRVVFRDDSFKDDVTKSNTVQTLRLAGIDDVKSV